MTNRQSSVATRAGRSAANDERVTWIDWGILALAVVSVLMLVVEQTFSEWFEVRPRWRQALIWADLGICGIFAVEFFARMRKARDKWAYTKSRWYDILGMIPVSHPLFRGFRMLRILRIVVISSRFVRATNRTFGEMAFEAAVRRFSTILVEIVSDAVLVRSLDTLEPLFANARFADSVAQAMEARRTEIRALVQRNLERMPGGSRMLRLKLAREVVQAVEDAAVEALLETLHSDELNDVFQEATVNFLEELRRQVIGLEQTGLMRGIGGGPSTALPAGSAKPGEGAAAAGPDTFAQPSGLAWEEAARAEGWTPPADPTPPWREEALAKGWRPPRG